MPRAALAVWARRFFRWEFRVEVLFSGEISRNQDGLETPFFSLFILLEKLIKAKQRSMYCMSQRLG